VFHRAKADSGVASESQEVVAGAYNIRVDAVASLGDIGSATESVSHTLSTLREGRTYTIYVFRKPAGTNSSGTADYDILLEEDSDFFGHARVRVAHASPVTAAVAAQLTYAEHANGTYPTHYLPSIGYGGSTEYIIVPVVNHSAYRIQLGAGDAPWHTVALGVGENWTIYIVPSRDVAAATSAGLRGGGASAAAVWAVQDTHNSAARSARGSTLTGQLQVGLRWMNALPPPSNGSAADLAAAAAAAAAEEEEETTAVWKAATCLMSGKGCLAAGELANYGNARVEYTLATLDSIAGLPERWGLQAQAQALKNGVAQGAAPASFARQDLGLHGGTLGTLAPTGGAAQTPELKLFIDADGVLPSFYATWKWAVLLGVASAFLVLCCGGLLMRRRRQRQKADANWSPRRSPRAASDRRTWVQ